MGGLEGIIGLKWIWVLGLSNLLVAGLLFYLARKFGSVETSIAHSIDAAKTSTAELGKLSTQVQQVSAVLYRLVGSSESNRINRPSV